MKKLYRSDETHNNSDFINWLIYYIEKCNPYIIKTVIAFYIKRLQAELLQSSKQVNFKTITLHTHKSCTLHTSKV